MGILTTYVNLQASCILYIEQAYRQSPKNVFYICSQQIHLFIFLDFLSPFSFIFPQNIVYFVMLSLLVHKIFTLYINGVLNCKCPAPEPKGNVLYAENADLAVLYLSLGLERVNVLPLTPRSCKMSLSFSSSYHNFITVYNIFRHATCPAVLFSFGRLRNMRTNGRVK